MKKFWKTALPILLVVASLTIGICYIVIPDEMKSATDTLIGYLNTPIGIGVGSTTTIGVVLYVIVKSVGKYLVDNNKINLELFRQRIEELSSSAKEYEEKAQSYYENTKVILSEFSNKVDYLSEELAKVCETSPNAKVKALASEIRDSANQSKQELVAKVEEIDRGLLTVVSAKPSIEELEQKIKDLTEKIEGLLEYGKEKEETHD